MCETPSEHSNVICSLLKTSQNECSLRFLDSGRTRYPVAICCVANPTKSMKIARGGVSRYLLCWKSDEHYENYPGHYVVGASYSCVSRSVIPSRGAARRRKRSGARHAARRAGSRRCTGGAPARGKKASTPLLINQTQTAGGAVRGHKDPGQALRLRKATTY